LAADRKLKEQESAASIDQATHAQEYHDGREEESQDDPMDIDQAYVFSFH
jgi:hypothetical protein